MIENTKARWLIIILVLVGSFVWTAPNMLFKKGMKDDEKPWWPTENKITQGLDIQGGLHLVMGVDVKTVITEKIARLAKGFNTEFKDQEISFQSIKVSEADKREIHIQVSSEADVEAVKKYIEESYSRVLQIVETENNRVVVRYYESTMDDYKKQVVEQAIEVIRRRIDGTGLAETIIAAQGSDRILVQIPGIDDAGKAKELINRTAQLKFLPVYTDMEIEEVAGFITEAETAGDYALGENELEYDDYIKRINKDLASKIPEGTMVVFQKHEKAVNLAAGKTPYLVEATSELGGDELEDAWVGTDEFGKPEVSFKFSVFGQKKFAALTEANVGGFVAIVLDNQVQSAPSISKKIDSPQARITLGQQDYQSALDEAQFIATTLRAGALPAALEQLEERTVGPTLGHDSIDAGKKAGIVGAIFVLIFMLVYYRFLGVVADIALGFNLLLIVAILSSLQATLTLPGVAGIVLTVGMAVDANVIIFERIREELRKGSGLQLAIKNGFGYALSAILDANITTAAVCIVLMYFGTGPVRGFAVTLICGIVTSMFTSIFVSRTIIDLAVTKFGVKNLAKV